MRRWCMMHDVDDDDETKKEKRKEEEEEHIKRRGRLQWCMHILYPPCIIHCMHAIQGVGWCRLGGRKSRPKVVVSWACISAWLKHMYAHTYHALKKKKQSKNERETANLWVSRFFPESRLVKNSTDKVRQ